MQEPSKPKTQRTSSVKACTECQRRRQKCTVLVPGHQCTNCMKRFPPVDCILPKSNSTLGAHQTVFSSSTSALRTFTHAGSYIVGSVRPQRLGSDVSGSISRHKTSGLPKGDDELARRSLFLDGNGNPTTPRPLGGLLTQVNGALSKTVALKPTGRNLELFNFFVHFVTPNTCSLDGQSLPALFVDSMFPWMMSSPLFPNIALLSSSAALSFMKGIPVKENKEILLLRASVAAQINHFLRQDFWSIAQEVLRSVIHLAMMEWFWGDDDNFWAHYRGLRQMFKVAGGLGPTNDPLLISVAVYTDYLIACWYETDLFLLLNDPMRNIDMPISESNAPSLISPILPTDISFESRGMEFGLSPSVAKTLDDVKFLTRLLLDSKESSRGLLKVQSMASWMHDKILSFPVLVVTPATSDLEIINDTVRIAGLLYIRAIMNRQPFSSSNEAALTKTLRSHWMRVDVEAWKRIIGISGWVLWVGCIGCGPDREGRFLRRKTAVTGMAIGMENFPLTIATIKTFWLVQRWLAKDDYLVPTLKPHEQGRQNNRSENQG